MRGDFSWEGRKAMDAGNWVCSSCGKLTAAFMNQKSDFCMFCAPLHWHALSDCDPQALGQVLEATTSRVVSVYLPSLPLKHGLGRA